MSDRWGSERLDKAPSKGKYSIFPTISPELSTVSALIRTKVTVDVEVPEKTGQNAPKMPKSVGQKNSDFDNFGRDLNANKQGSWSCVRAGAKGDKQLKDIAQRGNNTSSSRQHAQRNGEREGATFGPCRLAICQSLSSDG